MKIRFTSNTNIRRVPTSAGNKPIGIIYAGAELEVEDIAHQGAAISNNAVWYRDLNGWYYWSGKTAPVFTPVAAPAVVLAPPPAPPAPAPPPSVVEEIRPPVIAFPTSLPLPDDSLSGLPEGETRIPGEAAASNALATVPSPPAEPAQVSDGGDDLESFSPGGMQDAAPPAPWPSPQVPPSVQPILLWKTPDTRHLHWAHQGLSTWWTQQELTGRGIRVALLSTGADPSHPDLQGAIEDVFDVTSSSGDLVGLDLHGLGTQAAIITAGRGTTAFGAAPEATLLIGKIGNYDHEITPENLIAGLCWALEKKAHIIAMLVDFRDLDTAQREALEATIAQANAADVLLLAPVGNSTERRPENRYPASLESVVCIGAHDQYGQRSAFSAKSQHLDVLAPGEGLLTTDLQRQPVSNQKNTSIATAFAAGVLALMRQREMQRNLPATTAQVFLEQMRRTAAANKTITQGNDVGYGYGLLQPAALLQALG